MRTVASTTVLFNIVIDDYVAAAINVSNQTVTEYIDETVAGGDKLANATAGQVYEAIFVAAAVMNDKCVFPFALRTHKYLALFLDIIFVC